VASKEPARAAVVGAGIVGLSVAWFLQEQGFAVTVYDRRGVGAGSSAGNAGWICPAMTVPLPEPAVLRSALGSLLRPGSPLRIPPRSLPATWRFLAEFAAAGTAKRWLAGVASFAPLSALALSSYDALAAGGVAAEVLEAPIVAAFEQAEQAALLAHELRAVADSGQPVQVSELSSRELHDELPLLAGRAGYGLRVEGQRYLQPLEYVRSLAAAVSGRGAVVETSRPVTSAGPRPGGGVRVVAGGQAADFDACVLANGAWMGPLARTAGVRVRMVAGRGYSFRVPLPEGLPGPLYLPGLRVAATPAPGGMRVAGTMEFRPPDAPLDRRRIDAIARTARGWMPGAGWDAVTAEWVGPRPVTADGLPVIGRTGTDGVFVAGGHGMWGMTLGPATGRLLAELIATGKRPDALAPFDPQRPRQLLFADVREALA
jgi:D-amino-acid dehydrogenase